MYNTKKTQTNLLKIIGLVFLFIAVSLNFVFATLNYDEYTDDEPQNIFEVVEDNLGNPCTDICNVSISMTSPNGTMVQSRIQMLYFNASGAFNRSFELPLLEGNTTTYIMDIRANITAGGIIYNGTSDRTSITIYDIYPQETSMWGLAITFILLTVSFFFANLNKKLNTEHSIFRWACIILSLFLLILNFSILASILVQENVSSTLQTRTSTAYTVMIYVVIFTIAYYLLSILVRASKVALQEKKYKKEHKYD